MGITLCLGLTPQPSSNWEKRSCLWKPPSSAAVVPFPLISLSSPYALPILFPCYASALMACPLPSQQPSQLGNQKNVENAEVRVPPILKDPILPSGVGRLASAQGPPVGRGPGEVGLVHGAIPALEKAFSTHTPIHPSQLPDTALAAFSVHLSVC